MSKTKTAATVGGAGVIAACVAFLPGWEGMDKVAKRDMIGTGHPVTYCYGQTDEFGKVAVGTRFTKQECDEKLAESLPKYLDAIDKCIKVDMPDKTKAALLDASYNAGPAAVCRSPMVARMNAGDLEGGCNAFAGWYVRSDGVVRKGLVARRDGEDHGDHRKSEKGLCLEGLREHALAPDPEPVRAEIPRATFDPPMPVPFVLPATPRAGCGQDGLHCADEPPAPRKRKFVKRAPPPAECPWWRRCT